MVCFSISCLKFSNGCPEIYNPSISFSIKSNSFLEYSSCFIKVYFISDSFFFSCSPPKSNMLTCPSNPFLLLDWILSNMVSKEAIKVALVSCISSKAPALIKLSIHFLFTASPCILSQKDGKSSNGPCFVLSSTMLSTAATPTFLMLPKTKTYFAIVYCKFSITFINIWF